MCDHVIIRARFVPRFLRWAVGFQFLLVLLVGLGFVIEGTQDGRWMPVEAVTILGTLTGVSGVMSVGISLGRRNFGAAEVTPTGLRQLEPRTFHTWACLGTVRVKAGPFGNRWLEVKPDHSPPFLLTARPTHPAEVLEALEQFAGPFHPLTRAYATLVASE